MILKAQTIMFLIALLLLCASLDTRAEVCKPEEFVYGQNEILDQLVSCTLAKSLDLDLTPQSEYVKSTSKTLVEQGFSNKTTILFAKLGGLWTARRSNFVETGWKCELNRTTMSSIVEVEGLSMEVVERIEIPLHRNQHKLAIHKPCKTFDLPLWMCRQSKPIYRTTKTWVNRAFFNLTLSQLADQEKPKIEYIKMIFTCPETFNQKVTHSPSAMYLISRYLQNTEQRNQNQSESLSQREQHKRNVETTQRGNTVTHPVAYSSTQNGNGPATPPYHNSVNLITNQVLEVLRLSLFDCINQVDCDLSLVADHNSFNQYKYKDLADKEAVSQSGGLSNECSNKGWIRQKIEAAALDVDLAIQEEPQVEKRSEHMLKYPVDPNQLLNPYGYYHGNAGQMIDDDDDVNDDK